MAVTRSGFVAVSGGLALALVIAGFLVVETRNGPFEHEVRPAEHPVAVEGTYRSTDGSAPGGLSGACDSADAGCTSPRTEIDARFDGLPALDGAGVYAAFLVGPDRVLPAGELEPSNGGHELSFEADESDEGLERLVVALASENDTSEPSGLGVLEVQLPDSDGEAVALDEQTRAVLGNASGQLAVGQVGVVEVSATARAEIDGLPAADGFAYRAGFVGADGTVTPQGELDPTGEARTLDVRVERVVLADQERFVVALAPDGAEGLAGYPAVDVELETRSLFG